MRSHAKHQSIKATSAKQVQRKQGNGCRVDLSNGRNFVAS